MRSLARGSEVIVMDIEVRPTLNLQDLRGWGYEHDHFKVDSMRNTTKFQVGSCLSTAEVEEVIQKGWIVNIKAVG